MLVAQGRGMAAAAMEAGTPRAWGRHPRVPPLYVPPTPLSSKHRLQGIVLKLRYNRAGHMFEFPILLSPLLDWNILAAGE